MFIGSPLKGSSMEDDVRSVFGQELIGFFNNFGGIVPSSISKEEFSQKFYDSGF